MPTGITATDSKFLEEVRKKNQFFLLLHLPEMKFKKGYLYISE